MPLSGLPVNAALLKITQGSSGPVRKPSRKYETPPVRVEFRARFSVGTFPRDQQRGQPSYGSSEKYGEDDDGDHPLTRRLLKRSAFVPGFSRHATMISNRRRGSRMKRQT